MQRRTSVGGYVMLVATVMVAGSLLAFAQQQQQQPRQEQQSQQEQQQQQHAGSMTSEGELVRVNPEEMTLAIRTESEGEQEFKYTEETEVTGAQEGAAGLATLTGRTVVVHYEEGEGQQHGQQQGQQRGQQQDQPRGGQQDQPRGGQQQDQPRGQQQREGENQQQRTATRIEVRR